MNFGREIFFNHAIVRRNTHDVVMAEEDGKAVREGRPAGWGGGPGGEACRVGRLAAASGCWPGGGGRPGGMEGLVGGGDIRSKECSGVNIVT